MGDFIDYSKKKLLNFNDENLINFDKEPKINCLTEIKPLKNVQIPDLVFKGLNGGVDIDVKSPEMIPEHFRAILGIKRVYYVPPPFVPMSHSLQRAMYDEGVVRVLPGGRVAPSHCALDGTHGDRLWG